MLLTGEYYVLDGATALAVPTVPGQSMRVSEGSGSEVLWKSYDRTGQLWYQGSFDLMDFRAIKTTDAQIGDTLTAILKAASRMNGDFLSHWKKYKVDTYLEFDRSWGMGSSSTLISCLAQWADVSPYHLLFDTLGGSGYDVACAQADGPILYRLGTDELHIDYVDFAPAFGEQLYIVYTGRKQDTRTAREHYFANRQHLNGTLEDISKLSVAISQSTSLTQFEKALKEHESIIAKSLKLATVQSERFKDYWGTVKSLGAWGGDCVLATSTEDDARTREYFRGKGCDTVFKFTELMYAAAEAVDA